MGKFIGFLFKLFGIFCFILLLAVAGLSYTAQSLLTKNDVPAQADAIIALGGSYANAMHAAELQERGLAPVVYVGHFAQSMDQKILTDLGYSVPTPEAVCVRILQEEGVPEDAIRLFGQELSDQLDEAAEMGATLNAPQALILITSPYNVRLARMIYSDTFPEANIMVVSTPYEPLPASWWDGLGSIQDVAMESAAIIHYLVTK